MLKQMKEKKLTYLGPHINNSILNDRTFNMKGITKFSYVTKKKATRS